MHISNNELQKIFNSATVILNISLLILITFLNTQLKQTDKKISMIIEVLEKITETTRINNTFLDTQLKQTDKKINIIIEVLEKITTIIEKSNKNRGEDNV